MQPTAISITQTLTDAQKQQAAHLYFDAFGEKFIHLMRLSPDPTITSPLLEQVIRFELGHFAIQGETVIGGIGLVTGKELFAHFTYPVLRQQFSWLGAAIRQLGYQIVERFETYPANDEVLVDVLFVDAAARGMGIGTRLLEYAEDYARSIGRTKLILGVIDTNQGAKRLYERIGYQEYKYERSGRFTAAAGFTGAYLMRKVL